MIANRNLVNKLEVGSRIKKIRQSQGLTMEEFGKLINNAQKSNVSKWENGKSLPSNARLKIIAHQGGISVDELLNGTIKETLEAIIEYGSYLDNERTKFIETYKPTNISDTTHDFLNYFSKKQDNDINMTLLEKILSIWGFLSNTGIIFSDKKILTKYPPDSENRRKLYSELLDKAFIENKRYLVNIVEKNAINRGIGSNQINVLVNDLELEAEKLFNDITNDDKGLLTMVDNEVSELIGLVYDFTHNQIKRSDGSFIVVKNDNFSEKLVNEINNILTNVLDDIENLRN